MSKSSSSSSSGGIGIGSVIAIIFGWFYVIYRLLGYGGN